jgi:hypothetical protein
MKRSLPVLWGLAGVLALAGQGAVVRAELRVPDPVAQAGAVRSGAALTQKFAFVNAGPGPLVLEEVRSSCGCLVAGVEGADPGKPALPRTYRPGEGGVLLLEVNTLTQDAGEHAWEATFRYREGGQVKEAPVRIVGRIVTEVSVQPPALTVNTETPVAHEVVITDPRPQPLSVTAVSVGTPGVRARLVEQKRDEAGRWVARVGLEVGGDCPEGRHDGVLSILTTDPTYRELRVPVTVVQRVRQRVTASPSPVTLRLPAGQNAVSAVVRLRAAGDEEVLVEKVEGDDPGLVCRWAAGPGTGATVKVQAERSHVPAAGLQSSVRVRLSKPEPQTLTLSVIVTPE